jgi:hypothetical protein
VASARVDVVLPTPPFGLVNGMVGTRYLQITKDIRIILLDINCSLTFGNIKKYRRILIR